MLYFVDLRLVWMQENNVLRRNVIIEYLSCEVHAMAVDYTQIPAHIICKESYAAMIEAKEAKNTIWNERMTIPTWSHEYNEKIGKNGFGSPWLCKINEINKELARLHRDKIKIIDEYKSEYIFFDLAKTQKAINKYNNMVHEKIELRSKIEHEYELAYRETQDKSVKATDDFEKKETEAFYKKVLDNPFIHIIVQYIVKALSKEIDSKINEGNVRIRGSYYFEIEYGGITTTRSTPPQYIDSHSKYSLYTEILCKYIDHNVENIKEKVHLEALKMAVIEQLKKNIEEVYPGILLNFSEITTKYIYSNNFPPLHFNQLEYSMPNPRFSNAQPW